MRLVRLCPLIASLALITGCLGSGKRDTPESRADLLNKSDALVATGQRQTREGEQLIERAASLSGDAAARLTEEGNALKRRGQANIDRGTAMRERVR